MRSPMDEQQRRIGVNEAVFREAIERIEDLNETFATFADKLVLVCECGKPECVQKTPWPHRPTSSCMPTQLSSQSFRATNSRHGAVVDELAGCAGKVYGRCGDPGQEGYGRERAGKAQSATRGK
jgi:hypothetical protein